MTDEDIAKPKRQRLTLEQRIARAEAQAARLRGMKARRSRQLETREKIIVGAAVLNAMREDTKLREHVVPLLREKVTRELDREVIAAWLSPTSTPGL